MALRRHADRGPIDVRFRGLEANMRLNAPVPGSRVLAQTAPAVPPPPGLKPQVVGQAIAMTMRTFSGCTCVATIAVSFQT